MRTNIVINDRLMDEALKLTGVKSKREVVELALKTLIQLKQQTQIKAYRGKLQLRQNLSNI
jgi:Arc/MetJ family transcription regulator